MIHLHVHTKYSILDATTKIEELISYVKELGMPAVAITDHGNMYGSVEFYKEAVKNGIKPIIGCEVYIVEDVEIMKRENTMHHLILLCKNETGRQNLQHLVSESTKYKFNKRPRIDFNMLKNYHEGLICLSACMIGEVSNALRNDNIELAYNIANRYKSLFGDDYYIEYQAHEDIEQQNLNKQLVKLANDLNIKYVVTCDVHYLKKEEQKYQSMYVQIGQAREAGETYNDCYIQTEEEVINKCISTEEYNLQAIKNTHEIADKCNVEYPLSAPIIPHANIPNGYKTEGEYLKSLCNKGMKEKGFFDWDLLQWKNYMSEIIYDENGYSERKEFVKFNTVKEILDKYKQRAKYEIESVLKMGFEGYYLLVHSYISSAKRRGIARGSAGGSLLAFLCGIVDIDPIKYGLYFERFIDVGALDLLETGQITRKELKIPDVDADFSPKDRDKVMQYIINKYHEENVVCLGTFGYLWAKSAIKDIGRVLNIPFEITNEITKNIDEESIEEALEYGLLDNYKDAYPELFEYASKLSGLIKSHGTHACGKIIAMRNADYYNALEYDADKNSWVLQGDMHTADDLGLVKIDLLGLRTLDVIYDVLDMINEDYNYIAPHKINLCDKDVWNEFSNGNSLLIFQFESPGMRQMLKDMKCNSIDNLSAANALYRPGSKQYIPNYINRRNGNEEIIYTNNMLKPILASTYGIIVYQEQLIEIGRLAGLKNPDELRQATAKKKPKLMAKIEPEMKNGLMNLGWTKEEVDKLWNDILLFAKYSFNKSHSAAYALTAYITMYLKVHHPVEFITATINSFDGDANKIAEIIEEAKRMGVVCKFDNWRNILPETTCRDNICYLGINTIKGFGKDVSIGLKNLSFATSYIDLIQMAAGESKIDESHIEKMTYLDMFNEFGNIQTLLVQAKLFKNVYNRKQYDKKNKPEYIPEYLLQKYAKETEKQYREIKSKELFEALCTQYDYPKTTTLDKIKYQQEYLGYISITKPSLDEKYYYVSNIDKNWVTLYQIKTGDTLKIKFRKNDWSKNPFYYRQIIKVLDIAAEKRFAKDPDGNWIRIDEYEDILKKWQVLS